jgi:uncharacterized membrane protein YfcA
MDLSLTPVLILGGIVTGTIGGMLGLGGGVFLVPFLVIAFNLPMHQAIATSILAVIATSSAGAALHLERGLVNIRLGMLLETTTVAGAILGGVTANFLSGDTLRHLFAVLLLIVSGLMFWRNRGTGEPSVLDTGAYVSSFRDESSGQQIVYGAQRVPLLMGISLIAGNVSGLLGVGGGIFKVPAMTMLGGIPMKASTATSNFMIGVTAAASAFIYLAHGHMEPYIVAPTALGVLGGSFLGIRLSQKLRSSSLTIIFAAFLLLIAVPLLLR